MDARPLRLLLLEPSADDAERTLACLGAGARRWKAQRVGEAAALRRALAEGWDAVISEHAPPHPDAARVLEAVRASGLDLPLLVVARALDDAEVVRLMRAGVRDVVLKDRLARLLPALERELAAVEERAAHRAALDALREMEQKHRAVVQAAREAVCYSQDGVHLEANRAYLGLFGYADLAELEGVPLLDLIDKADHARFRQHMRQCGDGPGEPQEYVAIRRGGERFHIEAAAARVTINGEPCTQLLVSDVSKRKAAEARLQYLSQHDPLTGTYNRTWFLHHLEHALERARQDSTPRAIVYVDLHDLRRVIRTLGHAAADRVLLGAARELSEVFGPEAALARYGDHEFAALLEGVAPEPLGALVARVRQTLAAGVLHERGMPRPFACHVSFAAVTGAMHAAHEVMAQVFAHGARGAVTPFRRETPPPARLSARGSPAPGAGPGAAPARIDWNARIAQALERGAFRLIYQPVVNLHADPAELFEVLLRMVDDDGALVPAREFIAQAETSGQAAAIDRWVVAHAIRTLAELHAQGRRVAFFINLSAQALRDPALVLAARHALDESKLGSEYVIFEIDQAALAGAGEAAGAFLRAVERIGGRVCIDNFASVAPGADAPRAAPIAYLKLAGNLAANAAGDPVAEASLRAVVKVAQAMGKRTIAKGVESAEGLSVLWALGVDYVQGHYFQEGDAEPNYQFEDQATLTSEHIPSWAVADADKSR